MSLAGRVCTFAAADERREAPRGLLNPRLIRIEEGLLHHRKGLPRRGMEYSSAPIMFPR